MAESDLLLISDPGFEGSSLLFNLASSYSSNIIWLAAEPPAVIESIVSSYNFHGELRVISAKQWKSYNFVNILNLNEVSIAISKAGDNFKNFVLVFTIIPELLLIHGLEKTYLFILNTIWKIHNQGGLTFALMTKGAQSEREEVMTSRPFSFLLRLQRKLTDSGWVRNLIIESPIGGLDQDVYPLSVKGYRVELSEDLKSKIISTIKSSQQATIS
jgi:hypothetical protein